jgi:hypothetical protein
MDPASALPSYRIYRGSLLALLIGTVFAVWLLVRPGGTSDAAPPAALANVLASATPTATPAGGAATPAPAAGSPTPAPEASPPPATETPPPPPASPTATPRPTTYNVQANDTMFIIAERFVPPGETPQQYVQRLYTANNLGPNSILLIGQTIQLPPPLQQ